MKYTIFDLITALCAKVFKITGKTSGKICICLTNIGGGGGGGGGGGAKKINILKNFDLSRLHSLVGKLCI